MGRETGRNTAVFRELMVMENNLPYNFSMPKRKFLSDAVWRYWRQPTRKLKWRLKVARHHALARKRIDDFSDSGNEFVSEGIAASVLLPSRGRPDELRRTLKNIAETSGGGVEVLVRLDDDDLDCLEAQESFHAACAPLPLKIVIGPRGGGYRDLHNFVNDLAAMARGDFLVLFNDDAIFDCSNWGAQIFKWRERLAVLKFKTITNEHNVTINIFPAVHRKIFQILGHVSLLNHFDSWIEEVARTAGCHYDDLSVKTIHMHNESKDSNFSDARIVHAETNPEFHDEENVRLRKEDALCICAHIMRHGTMLNVVEKGNGVKKHIRS